MESSERGMNPLVKAVINPRKEYWPSWRFQLATSCYQVFHVTRLHTRARLHMKGTLYNMFQLVARPTWEASLKRNDFIEPY